MIKSIKIANNNDGGKQIQLSYDIELNEDIQIIHCTVTTEIKEIPQWLHPRKFDLRSRYADGSYTPLFSDENIKNMQAVAFIDSAYAEIMKAEKCTMAY
jgi:hypothetical protein